MPLRSDWSEASCPVARSLDVVGDPWVLLVLREALTGTTRFDAFRDALGVADPVLSRRLAGLVEAGLMVRAPYDAGNRTRHEYLLTDAGTDLLPVVQALALWGDRHRPRPGRPDAAGARGLRRRDARAPTPAPGAVSGCPRRPCRGAGRATAPGSRRWSGDRRNAADPLIFVICT